MTNNKMTLVYASPWKLMSLRGDIAKTDNTGFRDDAYSLGLLMLEVIFNKTEMESIFTKFIEAGIELKIK